MSNIFGIFTFIYFNKGKNSAQKRKIYAIYGKVLWMIKDM